MRDLRLAVAMVRAVVGDKAGNLERIRHWAAQAAARGAELVLFPEACLTGYTVRETMAPWAEPVPGPLIQEVTAVAGDLGLVIAAGLVERSDDQGLYLTQALVGPEGLLGSYRKTHLGPTEKTLFSAGEALGLFDCLGSRFGLELCYEGHFPEMSLALAWRGAEIILVPHASPREEPDQKLDRWLKYLPARAYDNTVFLAACNLVGDNGGGLSFSGAALIIGPKGDVLAQASGLEEGLITAELKASDLAAVKEGRMGFFLPQRRPDLYDL
ncbi:MAG: nitrilase-related carbon-nitrogen hydrolase [Thermodesulfobacteriota bacterium]